MSECRGRDPLGIVPTPSGADFAVSSANSSAVYLCLYDAAGELETDRVRLTRGDDGVHRGQVAGLRAGARYGLRVDGPFEPSRGHRFDVSKLLADPYAAAIDRPYRLHLSMFAHGADSGPFAPKCIVSTPPEGEPGRLRIEWDRTILYELNVRGFTRLRRDIPESARGRFAALAQPAVIAHLTALGVTSVEIMPADAFVDERHLPPLGLANAWGYNPVILGAPDPRLAPDGWAEVRAATDALHAAGMEAILDIVLNHNGESDEFGPTLSFRGLDNAAYFRLIPGDLSRYINDMGTGNCLALDRPVVVNMALAALRRWMTWGGIDGFRFDLAAAIGRRAAGFDPHAPLFQAIAEDPIVSKAKLIAEPWDIGPGGYRLGGFPPGWGEWNDRFRDTARRFWRGDGGLFGDLATRLAGSHDVFANAPTPSKSVNFIVAHDGFTLADLVSYSRKHNEANGENNRDGSNDEHSWNHGVEGPSNDPAIKAARARDMRNLLALLLVARGTPMLAMGSETGHSQSGNNNAYAQDNATSWIDWDQADAALVAFVGRAAALRRSHPALSSAAWLTGQAFDATGVPDVEWRDAAGPMTSGAQWNSPAGNLLMAVLAEPAPGGSKRDSAISAGSRVEKPVPADIDRVALIFNLGAATRAVLPEPRPGQTWRICIDTSDDTLIDAVPAVSDRLDVAARSTVILAEAPAANEGPGARAPDAREIDALAEAAGIAPHWFDVQGKRTIVSAATKLALLQGLRLPARSRAQARESLGRLAEETARRIPHSLTIPLDGALKVPLRSGSSAPQQSLEFHLTTEDGKAISGPLTVGEARRRALADGREIVEQDFDLPPLTTGRHRLEVDGISCALTVAPPKAYGAEAAWRRRFGVSGQLYALRRQQGDQGIGDFTTLRLAAAAAGAKGAVYFGVSPMHALFSWDRRRASPYHPSDRRFLDPFLIDVLDGEDLPSDAEFEAALAQAGPFATLAALPTVDYEAVWTLKRAALRARFRAFERARAARPGEPIFAEQARFLAEGGEALRRFAIFEAISLERWGENWRRWPAGLRDADPNALAAAASALAYEVDFALFCQWLADRQLAAAAASAKAAGLETGLYRDLAVGAAPDGAESWSRAGELATGASVGAPPDPFSLQGQIWHLPPPDPIAGAREGWRGLAALYGDNMRHAGMLRIDHAMGLTRLFVIPDGAKPAEGAYLAYPAGDLIGQIALESQRRRCMIVGEDLGTVPPGFRDRLAGADILGMRVLWFERAGLDFLPPPDYPSLSVASATTHDLPTLAGWWQGADIAERLMLGLLTLEAAERAIAERREEKRVLVEALRRVGEMVGNPDFEAPMTDALAAAIHGFLGSSGSVFASVQVDDLAGETIATNLPGTDRERPNWRHRLGGDVEALIAGARASAIIAALAKGRR
jgi:glycogen debranching enzyme GlgX/4-alpha-glucanotransferase